MYCFRCNANVDDRYSQCPYCGEILRHEQEESNLSTMILGIFAAGFACTFYLSFIGIILGIIAVGKSKRFIRPDGTIGGRAKAGRICGMVGIIAGSIMTLLLVLITIAVGSAIASIIS